ncbi:peptidoglycan glycosyltransferase FtsI [Candidatus Pantoea carbekii]|uniref:peptidoglycan glycosyltransferase FtsI n=1 Tax=Candidatus Pantoea carbekii TaxID=1235990 RepID=UPI0005C7A309|nr:peptidoglycan glycosyltransferase FtsI [Candidatus Pantoea carbekii]
MNNISKTLKLKKQKNEFIFLKERFVLIYSCILLAFISLLARVTWLQIINDNKLIQEGDLRSLRIQPTLNERGIIKDRIGRPLAVSVPVNAIWIDPKKLKEHLGDILSNSHWKALSKVLSIPLEDLIKKINANPKRRFLYLTRQVSLSISEYIKNLKLPYLFLRKESRRYYPTGHAISHLIGFTNIDGQGIEGIEKSFNNVLTGKSGKRIVRKDLYGHVIENISSKNSSTIHDLMLSIDAHLQEIVYRELSNAVYFNKAESGTVVLIDINTGEVLAMANSPTYNPNHLGNTSQEIIRNRAITDMFEPGSTVKPMVIMTALQKGVVKENSVLNTFPYRIHGYEIKDVVCYRELTLTGILQKSSNVGVSHLALAMPSSALLHSYKQFGLGEPTNLGLVGESKGLYPTRQQRSDIERVTFSFGYGLMVTPLQLARVYATIGSYGINHPLSIIKINTPIIGKRVFPKNLVKKVIHMMESVALPGGVGEKAAIKGYRIAIKTGTVKKQGPNGHYINKYIAYTAGVVPASHPRLAMVVVINDPKAGQYYGGAVAAPIFSTIMGNVLRTMNILPDALFNNDSPNNH